MVQGLQWLAFSAVLSKLILMKSYGSRTFIAGFVCVYICCGLSIYCYTARTSITTQLTSAQTLEPPYLFQITFVEHWNNSKTWVCSHITVWPSVKLSDLISEHINNDGAGRLWREGSYCPWQQRSLENVWSTPTDLLLVQLYSQRPKTGDFLWSPVLQTVPRKAHMWKVSKYASTINRNAYIGARKQKSLSKLFLRTFSILAFDWLRRTLRMRTLRGCGNTICAYSASTPALCKLLTTNLCNYHVTGCWHWARFICMHMHGSISY